MQNGSSVEIVFFPLLVPFRIHSRHPLTKFWSRKLAADFSGLSRIFFKEAVVGWVG